FCTFQTQTSNRKLETRNQEPETRNQKLKFMTSDQLRALQAPLKEKYKQDPGSAMITLEATGKLGEGVACHVNTWNGKAEAGLHWATGGSGLLACSGDMLLQALVACAGVTLGAIAAALNIEITDGQLRAEGDLDFLGTLGVS